MDTPAADNTVQVIAAVLEKDGLILIAQRKAGAYQAGRWEFPGGKRQAGETAQQCLARELSEELGITAAIGELICSGRHVYPHISIELLVYRAEHLAGEIECRDHARVKWVEPPALRQYDFLEADRPVIERLLERR